MIDTRSSLGEWKTDTLIGKHHKQALVSLTELKSRMSLIYIVERKTKDDLTDFDKKLLTPIRDRTYSMTSDNGKEFANHTSVANYHGDNFYFAHPDASSY